MIWFGMGARKCGLFEWKIGRKLKKIWREEFKSRENLRGNF
jgi:hypothetical protein